MNVHGPLVDEGIAPPDAVEQLGARQHAPWVFHQEFEQPELGRTDADLAQPSHHAVSRAVEFDIARSQHVGHPARRGPAQDRLDPRHQLRERERLDDVVIGTGRQPADAVGFLASRRQHDNRDRPRFGLRSQAAAQLNAGNLRQHPVEDNQIRPLLGNQDLGLFPALSMRDAEAFCLQIVAQHLGERLLVLDDQDTCSHALTISAVIRFEPHGRTSVGC